MATRLTDSDFDAKAEAQLVDVPELIELCALGSIARALNSLGEDELAFMVRSQIGRRAVGRLRNANPIKVIDLVSVDARKTLSQVQR